MKILGIIPARFASSRFPGKPLVAINGKPMVQCVYEQVLKCKALSEVLVATDDSRIQTVVKEFKGNVIMTSDQHKSGTDRCNEALKNTKKEFDAVINIQGDEPFIHPNQIDKVAKLFDDTKVQLATLAKKISNQEELNNPNTVKVLVNANNEALYFSRSAIPFYKGKDHSDWLNAHSYYKHIGIYGYRSNVLAEITNLPRSPLEIAESLEQLRWLENGYRITVGLTNEESFSIDTPEDLKQALQKNNNKK